MHTHTAKGVGEGGGGGGKNETSGSSKGLRNKFVNLGHKALPTRLTRLTRLDGEGIGKTPCLLDVKVSVRHLACKLSRYQ